MVGVTDATFSGTKVQNKGNPGEEPASEDDGDAVHVGYKKRTRKPNSRVFGPDSHEADGLFTFIAYFI